MTESGASSATPVSRVIVGPSALEPPGRFRRAAAGAWHVPAGAFFLLRHPRLWPAAVLPALMCTALLTAGLFLGIFSIRAVEEALAPRPGRVAPWLAIVITLALWVGTVAAGLVAGLALALLLTAPLLDLLSQRVERTIRGSVQDGSRGLRWEVAQSLMGSLFLVAATPLVFGLGLIPVIGPPCGMLWAAYVLAYQQTDSPLTRRGLDFGQRRGWHRRWRWESLGFGLTGLIAMAIPLANLVLAPALTVGGTRLVLEIEDLA